MHLAARRCIFSSFFISFFKYGEQTGTAYSSIYLIKVLNRSEEHLQFFGPTVLFMSPTIWFRFRAIVCTCRLHDVFFITFIPRCFDLSTVFRTFPNKKYDGLELSRACVIRVASHFSKLNFICQVLLQYSIFDKSPWRMVVSFWVSKVWNILLSSAKTPTTTPLRGRYLHYFG